MPLDLLTLKFDGSHTASNALSKLRDGSHAAWADEVGTVERHKTGSGLHSRGRVGLQAW